MVASNPEPGRDKCQVSQFNQSPADAGSTSGSRKHPEENESEESKMYVITKAQWDKIPDDYKTEKSITHGGRACFEGCINPITGSGTTLIFEGLHFVVLPDSCTTGDPEKDRIACDILRELSGMTPEQREAWRAAYTARYYDDPHMMDFIPLVLKVAADIADYERIPT